MVRGGYILPISNKDPAIRSHGHRCWFTEVCGVIARHELLTQHERRLRFSPVELDDLVEPNIRDPGVALGVDLESVRHVEQARAETGLHFPLVGIDSQDRVLLDELSEGNN